MKRYVFVGTAAVGFDPNVVECISAFAKCMKADLVHLGRLLTPPERRALSAAETGRSQMDPDHFYALRDEREAKVTELAPYIRFVEHFTASTKFVAVGAQCAEASRTAVPTTPTIVRHLRGYDASVVYPHTQPSNVVFPKEGENQCYQYMTTGSLSHDHGILGAVLVHVCEISGHSAYFAEHLEFVDSEWGPAVLYDGRMFTRYGRADELIPEKAAYITDTHLPYQSDGTVEAFADCVYKFKPGSIIDGGDTSDYRSVNRHALRGSLGQEGLRLEDDLNGLARRINQYRAWAGEVVIIDSNHAEWLTQYVEAHPELKGAYDWPSVAKRMPEGVYIKPRDAKAYWWHDLAIRHGDQEGNLRRAAGLYRKYLCGHFHRPGLVGQAAMCGAACQGDPGYMRGQLSAWVTQFALLHAYNGRATKTLKTVLHHGKYSYYVYQGALQKVRAK